MPRDIHNEYERRVNEDQDRENRRADGEGGPAWPFGIDWMVSQPHHEDELVATMAATLMAGDMANPEGSVGLPGYYIDKAREILRAARKSR